jgi:hypothetical protein
MSKMGTIKVTLEYEFPDDMSNEEIERQLQDIELPKEYVEDSFEYIGIWNTTDNKFEQREDA